MAEGRFTLEVRNLHEGQEHPDVVQVQKYLTKFGYPTTTVEPGRLDAATSDALRMFQHIGGLEEQPVGRQ
jgi:N-acetyl-anhydromuramyl-L-alanine amidase AmpD